MDIKQILGKDFLSKFKVYYPSTLFPPDFNLLLKRRCIICGNKLKVTRNGKIAYCRGKKHKKSFVITVPKLELIEFNYRDGLLTD